jgi:hypothetical protein
LIGVSFANRSSSGGNALQFNGSTDYVSVRDSPDWDFGIGDGGHVAGQGSNDKLPGLKPHAFELAIASTVGKPLEVEVERLPRLAEIRDGIPRQAEPEIVRCFQSRRPAWASAVRSWAGRCDGTVAAT